MIRVSYPFLFCFAFIVGFTSMTNCPQTMAAPGDPLAIQSWPGGSLSIETHSGFRLVIHDHGNPITNVDPLSFKLMANVALSHAATYHHRLFRPVNQPTVLWQPLSNEDIDDANAVVVNTVKIRSSDKEFAFSVAADNVAILFVSGKWLSAEDNETDFLETKCDVLVLPAKDLQVLQSARFKSLLDRCKVTGVFRRNTRTKI